MCVLIVVGIGFLFRSARSADPCTDWPFTTVSCEVFHSYDMRVQVAGPEATAKSKISDAEAMEIAEKENPAGAKALEARLVAVINEGGSVDSLRYVWAVAVELPDGIAGPATFPLYHQQLAKIHPPTDTRPVTANEEAQAEANVVAIVDAWRGALEHSFHIDYIDPETGAWLGAVEGGRPNEDRLRSLLPAGVTLD